MFCITLLVAGNETTTNLVGNFATALFANPDEAERLWADPVLVPGAVEEVLRHDGPAQTMVRRATTDTTIGGRNPRDHLAFGSGIHLCLGAALARLEGRVVFETLIDRVRNLRAAGSPRRKSNPLLRGFDRLPVAFEPV